MTCSFEIHEAAGELHRYRCAACGYVTTPLASGKIIRHCPASGSAPQALGWGDLAASALASAGITKELIASIFGTCGGCEQRQQWLNEVGKTINDRLLRPA